MIPNQFNQLRDQFLLDPSIIYFNHGSAGATPRPVFDSYQRWQRELERQPTEFMGRRAGSLMDESRAVLAAYLGTDPCSLAYVTNATTGLNVVARSLSLGPGDEVLSTDHEYGALNKTWLFLAQRAGFHYINQPIPVPVASAEEVVEALWKGVTPRTRVIFLSHITSPTALIFPIEAICRRARQAGILTVIDGAHAPGQIPLRLDELGADFYSGNLHKWLCAPKGAAFLYARSEVQPKIEPLVVSWGWESVYSGSSPLVDFVERQGTRDLSAFLCVPDAIKYFKENDWGSVRSRCHALAAEVVERMTRLTGLPPLSPASDEWFSQMVSVPLPGSIQPAELHRWLYEDHRIEIPIFAWGEHKLMRLSIQGYNTREETKTLVAALRGFLE